MLMLYNIKWNGTYYEFKQYLERVQEVSDTVSGMTVKGVYIPSEAWNYTILFELTSYADMLKVYQTFVKKYLQVDAPSRIELAQMTLLHTFEELGYPD
jgi:hypothetical protein